MRNLVTARAGETEVVEKRSIRGKVFQSGNKVRVVSKLRPLHWDDNGTLVDVDDTPESPDGGRTWRTPSTPYNLSWDSETLTLSYQSKKGGEVVVRLVALNSIPVLGPFPRPVVNGQKIRATIAPQLEIELRVRPNGVEIVKYLNGPLAPTSLTWEVVEGDMTHIQAGLMNTSGLDNLNRLPRTGLNRRRRIEMTHQQSADDLVANPGKRTYRVTETFTGRTRFIHPQTRARSFRNEVEWPVEIDVTVSESVVANADDGYGTTGGYWYQGPTVKDAPGAYGHGAVRFQTVNVPQGQVLDSAILTVNVIGPSGTGTRALHGNDVDDAAAWVHAGLGSPATMTATTASTAVAIMAAGIRTIDVLTSAQEIVDRAGWTANNDMRWGFPADSRTAGNYQYFEDYVAAGTAEPELEIIYTEAGGAAQMFLLTPNRTDGLGHGGIFPGGRI